MIEVVVGLQKFQLEIHFVLRCDTKYQTFFRGVKPFLITTCKDSKHSIWDEDIYTMIGLGHWAH